MSKSEHFLFILLSLLCVAISGGVVWFAAICDRPDDGGRGGAIAVAASFIALFLTRNYGAVIYDLIVNILPGIKSAIDHNGDETFAHEDSAVVQLATEIRTLRNEVNSLKKETNAITAQFQVNAQGQTIQNRYLVFCSVVGTLFWGFGDMAATFIIKHFNLF